MMGDRVGVGHGRCPTRYYLAGQDSLVKIPLSGQYPFSPETLAVLFGKEMTVIAL